MPQDYSQVLPYDKTPIEFLKRSDEKDEITLVTTFLGSIRFTYDEMHHTIGELSGGQKAKLLLLKMDLDQVNVLIVDEPTRNFSPLSQREVRQIFQNFEGCLIVVSHDRLFNQEVCHRRYRLTHTSLERLSNQKQ
ncbi:ATP-binding cassette domain-containing protein [Globicatella sp. PHS-GS-PNBC-21-1553]|uniref:ATP-binding cassette domain-containing protein n=1 Tax=Globicatella sp. PHS-GS-PNBC-21-1553 TaxID=2885764 RepID=UPI00298EDF18|nr:ATP-binding cassette domain-containing protein [Globicatella sp. PHS-GS-PNBC-21-1553]